MVSVLDVAAYILEKSGPMSAMKLQKLVYYAQAWSLVWDEAPLFPEKFQAWANGPVCPKLYQAHRKSFMLAKTAKLGGHAARVTGAAKETVDAIIKAYGSKSAHYLSELTHAERPWREARGTTAPGEPSKAEITHVAMAEFYDGLLAKRQR